ncbi:hypothetical protein [Delftia acidovorans]
MLHEDLKQYHSAIAADEGLASIRKTLTIVCIVFLAINLTGAKIEEANTFLFKVNLTNASGLGYLILLSIIFLTVRYFAYAQKYISQLESFWKIRLMRDGYILSRDPEDEDTYGLLSKKFTFPRRGEPDVGHPVYETSGFFKRSISYWVSSDYEDYDTIVDLNKFDESWKRQDLFILILKEFYYQAEATLKYRESLDLYTPFMLSLLSILSFFQKEQIMNLLK